MQAFTPIKPTFIRPP